MDSMILFMDNFLIHLHPIPRLLPGPLPVRSIGYVRRKDNWIRQHFDSFNFSFILSGTGRYHTAGRVWNVAAPCIITQWPKVYVEYGPDRTWEELFIIYGEEQMMTLEAMGFACAPRPVWYVRDAKAMVRAVERLRECLDDLSPPGQADRIDRLCESAVLESLLGQTPSYTSSADRSIAAIRRRIEERFAEPLDFNALATAEGMSPATFRRHWARAMSVPPGRYQTDLRMQHACRLLAETSLPIGEIATRVGFEDALYFSRRFRQSVGHSARDYRNANRVSVMREE